MLREPEFLTATQQGLAAAMGIVTQAFDGRGADLALGEYVERDI